MVPPSCVRRSYRTGHSEGDCPRGIRRFDKADHGSGAGCGRHHLQEYPVEERFMQSMAPRIVQRKSGHDERRRARSTKSRSCGEPLRVRHAAGAPARHVRTSAVSTSAPSSSVGWRQVAPVGLFPVWINAHSFSYARDSARGAGGHMVSLWQLITFFLYCALRCAWRLG